MKCWTRIATGLIRCLRLLALKRPDLLPGNCKLLHWRELAHRSALLHDKKQSFEFGAPVIFQTAELLTVTTDCSRDIAVGRDSPLSGKQFS